MNPSSAYSHTNPLVTTDYLAKMQPSSVRDSHKPLKVNVQKASPLP